VRKPASLSREFPVLGSAQLGPVLRGFRKEAGLSQREVAARGGLLQKTVSRLETDASHASVEMLFRLLHALGVEPVLRRKRSSGAEW
jgi:HTH-type transcriptional regulator / antitoxin HipB